MPPAGGLRAWRTTPFNWRPAPRRHDQAAAGRYPCPEPRQPTMYRLHCPESIGDAQAWPAWSATSSMPMDPAWVKVHYNELFRNMRRGEAVRRKLREVPRRNRHGRRRKFYPHQWPTLQVHAAPVRMDPRRQAPQCQPGDGRADQKTTDEDMAAVISHRAFRTKGPACTLQGLAEPDFK